MKQFRLLTAAALLCLLVLSSAACQKKAGEAAAPTGASSGINWMGYTEGMAAAKQSKKYVMVDFYTTWCKYCKLLDETTYADHGVVEALNKDFVAIKVNAEGTTSVTEKGKTMTEQELAKAYKVDGFPTIYFFDSEGRPFEPIPGYKPPEEFKPVLSYISSGAYTKGISFSEYIKSTGQGGAPASK